MKNKWLSPKSGDEDAFTFLHAPLFTDEQLRHLIPELAVLSPTDLANRLKKYTPQQRDELRSKLGPHRRKQKQ